LYDAVKQKAEQRWQRIDVIVDKDEGTARFDGAHFEKKIS